MSSIDGLLVLHIISDYRLCFDKLLMFLLSVDTLGIIMKVVLIS